MCHFRRSEPGPNAEPDRTINNRGDGAIGPRA
jgi:hypothetical protein